MPVLKEWLPVLPYINQLKDLNWYGLKVTGLDKGMYKLEIDGKEAGTFTAYLARSPGAATVSGTAAPFLYLQYDIVSYISCTMDTHIAAVGWNVSGSNPPGANVRPNPVTGWREYNSMTP